jgi:serine/threonine-protein kinase
MELVRGEPLSALLRGGERMPPDTAADLVGQAADGITAAHRLGIVHRDVKPGNLLVTPDGSVKITDFGIARAADAVALTQTGQVIGTPQYLSPEQAEGKPATEASDIYSLGVVLYECLAGRRPFDGDSAIATALSHVRDTPPELPDDVPAHLRETVRVALAKDPAARFTSAAAFATALHGGPVQAGAGAAPDPAADAPTQVAGAAVGAGAAAAAADRDPEDGTRVLAPPSTQPPGPARRDDRDRSRGAPTWWPWLAAGVAVLLVILGVALLAANRDDTPSADPDSQGTSTPSPTGKASTTGKPTPSTKASGPSPSRTSATPDDRVEVDPGDYIGRPRNDARHDLEDLGLTVEERTVDNPGDQEKDTVADVSPSGKVDPDETVTLSVYDKPAAVDVPETPVSPGATPKENGKGKQKR